MLTHDYNQQFVS